MAGWMDGQLNIGAGVSCRCRVRVAAHNQIDIIYFRVIAVKYTKLQWLVWETLLQVSGY